MHGDAARPIYGTFANDGEYGYDNVKSGAFYLHGIFVNSRTPVAVDESHTDDIGFDSRRVTPAANKNQPRAWGALACVYLGAPK